jgi:predicted AlkP superfamily phosphohydrolase/phosphomutase/tetratricopeptide (TPR) repeat protein
MARKVLVIGWDAADWKIIQPLIDSGEMPTLKKFLEEGVYGNISTIDPPLSPILWTSIATGKLPEQHGILNFVEPDNINGGIKPVSTLSRKSKAIWNILNQSGLTSNVIGWWPSNPAEPINGIMVSNLFQKSDKSPDDPWPIMQGSVHPKELENTFAEMRIHPGELTEQHIVPFVPDVFSINNEKDTHISVLATMLAETATIQASLTWAMENKPADFTAVYFDGIDHFCHAFMKYHPPRISDEMPEELFNLYKDVVKGAYKFHDMMLERQLQLAGEDATVIILSDHGFHSDHMRPLRVPNEPAGPIYEHREYGIFCMKGPGIKKNHQLFGTSLLDVTPTLLTLYGLPIGKDMAGKPLLNAFEKPFTPQYIESWEKVEGDTGMHPTDLLEDPIEANAALMQLIQLGYIEDPGEDKNRASENCIKESQYYLCRSLIFTKSFDKALPIAELLFEKYGEVRFAAHFIHCLLQLKRTLQCRIVLNKLIVKMKNLPPSLRYHEASLLIAEKQYRLAIEILKNLSEKHNSIVGINIQLGNIYLTIDKTTEAIESFNKALGYNPDNANAYFGLGLCYSKQKKYEEASENFLRSIELVYYNPSAHYHLGEAQALLGEDEYALQAFEAVVVLSPGMSKARHWLVNLYTKAENKIMAERHAVFLKNIVQKPVVIVSGLPRSGTSMMMQMLHDAGADILTDTIREADDNNPKGYFEFEPVKKLAEKADWLLEQSGKTIKIIAQLLPHLPISQKYKIIFMEREMDEVLRSQQVMLSKNIPQNKTPYPMGLAEIFGKQLTKISSWLETQPNIETLYMDYASVVENPLTSAKKIESFLQENLDVQAMANAVDKTLYRNQNPVWK